MKYLFAIIFLFVYTAKSQDICKDYRIYDGDEPLFSIGIDTTFNWWAITNPTTDRYRLIINGGESGLFSKVEKPVFSYDGFKWGSFVIDQGVTTLLTNDSTIFLYASEPGEIKFSSITNQLVYSYRRGSIEYAVLPGRTVEMMNKSGGYYVNQNATRIAYPVKRGSSYAININGRESTLYDRVLPFGFDVENKFIYAAYLGNGWQVYADNKTVSEIYPDIYEFAINREGTCYAFACRTFTGRQQVVLYSNELYEPIISKQYEAVNNLVLHPYYAISGFSSIFQTIRYVSMNSAEYFAGVQPGPPQFTYDGDELYFISCDIDCFMYLNGKRYNMKIRLEPGGQIAVAPGTKTLAYTTNTSLMVYYLETHALHSGMMADFVTPARFNRFDNRYEALGVINNRIYLMTCAAPKRF
ncbi:hypothetical protein MASR1M45_12790 [Candidatus Kapaibacterium sp.]